MEFPQYRRYKNGKSYFKIINVNSFIEYKLSLKHIEEFKIVAIILPDRNYIQDMLTDYEDFWEIIEEKDLTNFLSQHPLK